MLNHHYCTCTVLRAAHRGYQGPDQLAQVNGACVYGFTLVTYKGYKGKKGLSQDKSFGDLQPEFLADRLAIHQGQALWHKARDNGNRAKPQWKVE
eukprot:1144982-Pelagomonas_calceolata.AAC.5